MLTGRGDAYLSLAIKDITYIFTTALFKLLFSTANSSFIGYLIAYTANSWRAIHIFPSTISVQSVFKDNVNLAVLDLNLS